MSFPKIFTIFLVCISTLLQAKTTVSVNIPCAVSHIEYLPRLLQSYANQTSVPEEVVISISSVKSNKHKKQIESIKKKKYPFKLKIISSTSNKKAGANRNTCAENSSGNLIVNQDADDLPHKQRIQIIKSSITN